MAMIAGMPPITAVFGTDRSEDKDVQGDREKKQPEGPIQISDIQPPNVYPQTIRSQIMDPSKPIPTDPTDKRSWFQKTAKLIGLYHPTNATKI